MARLLDGINKVAFIDFETTGLDPMTDYPTEIAIKMIDFSSIVPTEEHLDTKLRLPNGVEIPQLITELTGLNTEELNSEGVDIDLIIAEVQEMLGGALVVAHNANFDLGFLFYHFGVSPSYFMCTRTIEILTHPELGASLKDVHPRYAKEAREQTHRAMDDVNMLDEVFAGQIAEHGETAMDFFINKIVDMPDRPLVFTPHNAIVLDFTQKYYSSKTVEALKKRIEELERDSFKLSKLEVYGVDNWCGYDDAISDSMGLFHEEDDEGEDE